MRFVSHCLLDTLLTGKILFTYSIHLSTNKLNNDLLLDLPFDYGQQLDIQATKVNEKLPVIVQWQGRRLGAYMHWGLCIDKHSTQKVTESHKPVTLVDAFSIFRYRPFAELIQRSRCLVPATYNNKSLVTFAGIWQRVHLQNQLLDTYALLGTFQIEPCTGQTHFHPMLVDNESWERWLKPKTHRFYLEKIIEQGSKQPCAGKTPACA